jgi:hypothetical protein
MFYKNSIFNILSSITANSSLLFYSSQNLYFNFLNKYLENNTITDQNQAIFAIIGNDPINYSQEINKKSLENHVYSIIIFDQYPPANLKKEDKYILEKKLKNSYKIFISDKIKNSWTSKNSSFSYVAPYGFEIIKQNHKKNILVLNFQKHKNIYDIYTNLKNRFIGVDIVDSLFSHENISEFISDYKIVVSLGDIYNTIACASFGCFVISNTENYDPKIKNIFNITTYSDIEEKIKQILDNYKNIQNNCDDSIEYIEKTYPIEKHVKIMSGIFQHLKNRPFIYET